MDPHSAPRRARGSRALLRLALACGLVSAPSVRAEPLVPPTARRGDWADTLHGEVRVDAYHWLRERENPEVRAYLEAEQAYTESVMAPTRVLQERIYQEMVGRLQGSEVEVPYKKDGRFYYSRFDPGRQYPVYCRRQGSMQSPESVVLDLNELAAGRAYLELGAFTVSDDGIQLAFSTDTTGYQQFNLQVKNLLTGEVSPILAERTGTVAWSSDHRTLFYTVEDEAKRQHQLYRHEIGTGRHDLIYTEADDRFSLRIYRGRSRAYIYLWSASLTTSEWRFLDARSPRGEWRPIELRRPGIEYAVEDDGRDFYVTVNDTGRNCRLVKAPRSSPGREHWLEILPCRPDVMLEGIDIYQDWTVRYERSRGLPQMTATARRTGESWPIEFPEPAYSISPGRNAEFVTDAFEYVYTSMVTPRSVYRYDFHGRSAIPLQVQPVSGDFDREAYRAERLEAIATDGTPIPISVVYRVGTPRDGTAGCVLEGYGAYGFPVEPRFSSARLSLLDRGVIFAVAHVRGGGEMGKPWHDGGRMLQKVNSVTDYIACAERLIDARYTSPDRLVAEGGSAGGLLLGAVLNRRPDLFRAFVLEVPFVDLINTMADPSLPLTVAEFEEWGDPRIEEQYRYMRTYSPYDNLQAGAYPAILVRTSFQDSQVMYWEPAKFVAKLRALKSNPETPLLLDVSMDAGHGGASGRYDYLREAAFAFAFVLDQLGLRE